MATLYGRGRGKARSHAPKAEKPYWVKMESKEIEEVVVKLAKQGLSSAKIGLMLRDNYGIPSTKTVIGKKVEKILAENNVKTQDYNIVSLEKRQRALKKHLEKNKKDMTAKRGLQLTEAKIRRLEKYSKRKSKK
jgi:small subunit ribosomal protein S15